MQTTLLGLAIAIILALVTALVGPLLIDWGQYRGEFEARASRLTGLDFHVTGAIDARLLPTPTLVLQGIEFGRPDEAGKARARALRIEFALAALVRGEWRISDARLEGPEFAAGLDGNGRLAWPAPRPGFDLQGVSIDRLTIEGGRAALADAASGARLVLENLEFKGELRSLMGPIKGAGSFTVGGRHYPYRVSASHLAEDNGVKVRLTVDPIDQPLTVDADVSIRIEDGAPRFEGGVQLARPVGRAPAGASALITEPWRVSSRLRGDGRAAVLEQIELQYGPDERAIKLKGNANLTFGARPEIIGVLSSPQIDLDRVLALPDASRGRPLVAMRTLAEFFAGTLRPPIPTTLSIGVETVTLGGAMLARVGADLKSDADGLDIKGLEFRAPGASQIRLSGRVGAADMRFEGSTRIEANDPRALVTWLTERGDAPAAAAGPLRLAGDVTLGRDAIAIDRLKLELDRMTVAGRFAYAFPSQDRPARLDAALTAPEIDLDRVQALAKALLGGAALDWPREGALSLKIGRAVVAGVEAKQADVEMRVDAAGLAIERLAVADFGGAALAVKGRIDSKGQGPRGALSLDLDARALDGVTALIETFAPQVADRLRRAAPRLVPLTLRAALAVEPDAAGTAAKATFKTDGRAGAFRVAVQGDAGAESEAFKLEKLAALAAAKVNLTGRLDADDGRALSELIGLDSYVAVDKRPGQLTLTAKGSLESDIAIEGKLVAGALDASANGAVRLPARGNPDARLSAGLNLKVNNANVLSPRPASAGRPTELLPTSVSAGLDLSDGTLSLSLAGTVAGTSVNGRLAVGIEQQPVTVDGDLELGSVDLPAAIATALGMPAQKTGSGPVEPWPADPFDKAARPIKGQITFKSARVAVTPKLAATELRGVVRFGEPRLSLQVIEGSLAGGRVAGELIFLPPGEGEGLLARGRVRLAGVNAEELLPGDGSISGRLTLDASAEGTGMSAVALVGSLAGKGSFTLENGKLARLDPTAFETVIRAVDQGLPIDAARVKDKMDAALAGGKLAVALAEGAITIDAGQARLSDTVVRARGADLAVAGSVNLADGALDARLTLSGAVVAAAGTRPEIVVALKGPIDSPKRTTDVAALSSWLALRAVDDQSKKLDLLEGRVSPPTAPAVPIVPVTAPAAEPAQPKASEPEVPRPRPTLRTSPATSIAPKPKAAPAAEHVQPLPPPIDIRPAPAARAPRPPAATQGAAKDPPRQPVAGPPARPRSLSEILFGR